MKKPIFLLAFLLSASISLAQNLYVKPGGDDGTNGTTIATAWETVQHAMDNATPGSTVQIMAGTYNERVYVNVDGTANNFITFKNHQNDVVSLDGAGLTDYALLEMYDVEYVRIEGLRLKNNTQTDAVGILIEGQCKNIEILNCKISNVHFSNNASDPATSATNSQPLIVYGTEADAITGLLISGNEIFNCRTGYSEALAVNGNVEGFEVSGNSVHDITNIGIDIIGHEGTCSIPAKDQARSGIIRDNHTYNCLSPYANAAGIYVDGGKDLTIENNRVHNNQWGIEIGCENVGKTTENVMVRNNFIYNNDASGLALGGYDYPNGSGHVKNVTVRHNTFYHNDMRQDNEGEMVISYVENGMIEQNVFYCDNGKDVLYYLDDAVPLSNSLLIDHNLWYTAGGASSLEVSYHGTTYSDFSGYQSGTGQDANSLFADPVFKDIANQDLHLLPTSPAKDAGKLGFTPAANEKDIDGEPRVSGRVDIGADEFYPNTGLGEVADMGVKLWPNPASNFLRIEQDGDLVSLQIFDVDGRMVFETTNAGEKLKQIDVSKFNSGVFFVRIENTKGVGTARFVKN